MSKFSILFFISLIWGGATAGPLGSDWPATCFRTPNQNLICDDDDNQMGEYLNDSLGHFDKWYFYKDCIIGVCEKGFFIVNEKEPNSLYVTALENNWQFEIQKRKLKPSLWTKWFTMEDGHWFDNTDFDSETSKYWGFYLLGFLSLVIALVIEISSQTSGKWTFLILVAFIAYRLFVYFRYDLLNSY